MARLVGHMFRGMWTAFRVYTDADVETEGRDVENGLMSTSLI